MLVHLVKSCTASKMHVPFDILPFENIAFPAELLYNFQPRGTTWLRFRSIRRRVLTLRRKTRVSLNTFELADVPPRKISFGRERKPLLFPAVSLRVARSDTFLREQIRIGGFPRLRLEVSVPRAELLPCMYGTGPAASRRATTCTARRQSMN